MSMFSFPTNPLRDGLIEVSTVADRRFSRYLIECSSQQNKRKKKSRFNRLRTLTVIIIHVRVLNDYVRTCSYENNKLGYGINQKKKRRLVSVPQKCAKYMGTIRHRLATVSCGGLAVIGELSWDVILICLINRAPDGRVLASLSNTKMRIEELIIEGMTRHLCI